ncbi:MAG TPA: hypothetical protein VG408_07000, partial [Actinomycetota bacterium]|nr:hypothetical protein [Actinomycetota bacterium]
MTLRSLLRGLACAVALTACTQDLIPPLRTPAAPSPTSGGNLRFGIIGEPPTLDPFARRATDLTFQLAAPRLPQGLRFEVQRDGTVAATGR